MPRTKPTIPQWEFSFTSNTFNLAIGQTQDGARLVRELEEREAAPAAQQVSFAELHPRRPDPALLYDPAGAVAAMFGSVANLRAVDVPRLLNIADDGNQRELLAGYVAHERPDLQTELERVLNDEEWQEFDQCFAAEREAQEQAELAAELEKEVA